MKLDHFPASFYAHAFRPYFGQLDSLRDRGCGSCGNDNLAAPAQADAVQPPVTDATTADSATSDAPQTKVVVAGAEISQTRSATVKIKTQEGDEISIELNQSFLATALQGTASGPGGEASAQSYSLYADTALTYSVQGDLNDEEQAAIDSLLKDVDKLARQFYRGNIAGAFKRATNLGFDADTLAGIAINLSQTRTVTAIAAYQTNAATLPAPADVPASTPVGDVVPTTPLAVANTTAVPVVAPVTSTSTTPAAATPPATTATDPAPAATPSAVPATQTSAGTIPDLLKFLRNLHQLLNDAGASELLDNSQKTVATLVEKATSLKVDIVANKATGVNADGQNVLKTLIESAAKAEPAKEVTPDGTAVAA